MSPSSVLEPGLHSLSTVSLPREADGINSRKGHADVGGRTRPSMTRVMAQGTFDVVHPGHLHYLRQSADLGDELYVVVARDSRVTDRKTVYMDETSRVRVVDALEMVDEAILGSEGDLYDSVSAIEPDIITLGYDQAYDESALQADLDTAGFEVRIERIGPYEGAGVTSSSAVKERLMTSNEDGESDPT